MNHRRSLMAVLVLAGLAAPGADARAQDLDLDLDVNAWTGLARMPVAVARLDLAGVPLGDLRLLIPALNTPDVPPTLFLETVRGIPVLWDEDERWDEDARRDRMDGDAEGMGDFVQAMHARGLRGRELADAIHAELRRRGVPAGPKDRRGQVDVFDRDYIDDGRVNGRFRDDAFFDRQGEAGFPGRGRGIFRDGRGRPGQGDGARGATGRPDGARGATGGPDGARGATGSTGRDSGARGSTGEVRGNTGGAQGSTGGARGNTGGARGNAGGARGNTGGGGA